MHMLRVTGNAMNLFVKCSTFSCFSQLLYFLLKHQTWPPYLLPKKRLQTIENTKLFSEKKKKMNSSRRTGQVPADGASEYVMLSSALLENKNVTFFFFFLNSTRCFKKMDQI